MIAWTDVETTGLSPQKDHLLEVAIVITDDDLKEVSASSVVVQPVGVVDVEALDLDPKVRKMHTENGLFEEVKKTPFHRYEGEQLLISMVKAAFANVPPVAIDKCAQCGRRKVEHSSIMPPPGVESRVMCQAPGYRGVEWVAKMMPALGSTPLAGFSTGDLDRNFLRWHMRQLESLFSYHTIDITSITEIAKRWAPRIYEGRPKAERETHRALQDVRESIEYLRYYRETGFINCAATPIGTRFDCPSNPSTLGPWGNGHMPADGSTSR